MTTTEEKTFDLSANKLLKIVRDAKSLYLNLQDNHNIDTQYGNLLDRLEKFVDSKSPKLSYLLPYAEKMQSSTMQAMPDTVKISAWILLAVLREEGFLPPVFSLCCDAEEDEQEKVEDRWLNISWPKEWISAHLYHDGSWTLIFKANILQYSASERKQAIDTLRSHLKEDKHDANPETQISPETKINTTTMSGAPQPQQHTIRSILIIGSTGAGKSSICNVLYNQDAHKVAEPFKVNDTSASVTKIHKILDGDAFRIIDTIGLGDIQIPQQQIIDDVSAAVDTLKNGIHICMFVLKYPRVDKNAMATFKYVSKVILGDEASKNSLLVVTHCKQEGWVRTNSASDPSLTQIVDYCKLGAIEVTFPSVDEADKEQEGLNRKQREISFSRLLEVLSSINTIDPIIPELSKVKDDEKKKRILESLSIPELWGGLLGKAKKALCVQQ